MLLGSYAEINLPTRNPRGPLKKSIKRTRSSYSDKATFCTCTGGLACEDKELPVLIEPTDLSLQNP